MKILFTLIFFSLVSFAAQASTTEARSSANGFDLDLAIIADACNHPDHYNNQNAPTNIQISCSVFQMNWRMGKPGTMSFPGIRVLTTGVSTNKTGVGLGNFDFTFPETRSTFPCPNFTQTSSNGEFSFNVTCQDVAAMVAAGTSTVDYCDAEMIALVEADESLMVTTLTGKTATGCGMFNSGHGQN